MTSRPLDHASAWEDGELWASDLYLSPGAKDREGDGCGRNRPAAAESTGGEAAQTARQDSLKRANPKQRGEKARAREGEQRPSQKGELSGWMGNPGLGLPGSARRSRSQAGLSRPARATVLPRLRLEWVE
jgi:hypothetical protein